MASRFWVAPAIHGDWGVVGSWSATDGGASGASVPVSTDTATIKQGAYSIDTGLNQSAVALTGLNILNGFAGNASGLTIGDSSNSLQIDATTLNINNTRCAFIKLAGAYTTVNVYNLGGCQLFFTGGSIVTLNVFATSGYIEIADDVELTTCRTAGCNMTIKGDSTSPLDLELDIAKGAFVDCWRKVAISVIHGKLQMSNAASFASSGTPLVKLFGTLDYQAAGALTTTLLAYDGAVFTTANGPGFQTPPTLTALYRFGRLGGARPSNRLTITNEFAGDDAGVIGGPG